MVYRRAYQGKSMITDASGGCHSGDTRVFHHKGIACRLASALIFSGFDERVGPFGVNLNWAFQRYMQAIMDGHAVDCLGCGLWVTVDPLAAIRQTLQE